MKEAEFAGIQVQEKHFSSNAKGLCKGAKIAINYKINNREKLCVLAEELGHYYTTVGNILDQSDTSNVKQEHKARAWAIDKLLPFEHFERAANAGCRTPSDVAEFLDLDEEFVRASMSHYERKLGMEFPIRRDD
ncbi:ImmA/IrrE family metallo-endopeptidase [Aminipila butyrica]|uniref:ImmA/IrrE family metallo-endopeptidase n=1 Tax=Aminipila butyrica TaxID=433296 RepID=A0A858BRU9_9FIRM|nr:ImmA/IrrE family metallo-endopeptidase [Aminipila butyrica]QIB68633.1 ImmA/IrrE family metallo-endopeptidase [Aminipila butyrica]